MKKLSYIILILFGLFLALLIKVVRDLELLKEVKQDANQSGCQYFNMDMPGPEDIHHYRDDIYIAASGDLGRLFATLPVRFEQHHFYSIQRKRAQFVTTKLLTIGFPSNVALYIHGIYIRGNKLYAINHAYAFGGERIEIFEIDSKMNVIYLHSILLPDQYLGTLNDLVVVSDNRLLVTQFFPIAHNKAGFAATSLKDYVTLLFVSLAPRKLTYVLDCYFDTNLILIHPECQTIKSTLGAALNGIAWDEKETVWIADTRMKEINEFKLTATGLDFVSSYLIQFSPDNIQYDRSTNSLVLGLIGKRWNTLWLHSHIQRGGNFTRSSVYDLWSLVGKLDLNSGSLKILFSGTNLSKGLSGAVLDGEYALLTSYCDVSIMVCPLPQNART